MNKEFASLLYHLLTFPVRCSFLLMDSPGRHGISHIPFTFPASDGAIVHCDARFHTGADHPLPVIVFVHGFKGFKDWGWGPYLTSELARRGFYVLSFNFTYNGVEGDDTEFTRLDLFARNTYSREVRELREVIDIIVGGKTPEPRIADSRYIGLLGHSRGGGIVLIEASRDDRIRAVATWGGSQRFQPLYRPAETALAAAGIFRVQEHADRPDDAAR